MEVAEVGRWRRGLALVADDVCKRLVVLDERGAASAALDHVLVEVEERFVGVVVAALPVKLTLRYFLPAIGKGFSEIGYNGVARDETTSNRSDGSLPTVSMLKAVRNGTCTRKPLAATNGSWPSIVKRIRPDCTTQKMRSSA
jgi:hypothetical protein